MGAGGVAKARGSQRGRIRRSTGEDGGAGAGRREDAGAMAQRNAGGTLGEILGQIMAVREKPGKPESSLQFS